MTFESLGLIDPILRALKDEGYTTPTPIQAQAIPSLLQGRDLLGCAQTGTGKTAAFAIPILQDLYNKKKQDPAKFSDRGQTDIKALILTPTRELAIQIEESFRAYGRYLGLRHLVIFGGVSQHAQTAALQKGVDILVATPGRLLDLMDQRFVHLHHISLFVLDEADRMLDMGFVHDVKKVIARLPKHRQSLFFSATMPSEIVSLANSILHEPMKVEVTPVSSTADTVDQAVYVVDKGDKKSLLNHLLKDKAIKRALVFTRTKHGADKVVKDLDKIGVKAAAIHGNKSQNARQKALGDFKTSQIRILVATDIAARGIDVDDLTHVINYEIPNVPETYVHRIGRTGRAGASGKAISFCDEEEKEFLRDIQKLIGKKVPIVSDHPYPLDNQEIEKPQKNQPPKKAVAPGVNPVAPSSSNRSERSKKWFRGRKENKKPAV
ncbi:MAG TPA: DEAD/DEAH box helicase [Catalimonadaceae bacterium]|nr:DEAD/DEAH box helicase [Catalimonadaceae bacterium]HPI11829.1 DEAD/DEAH box helicase [Catalimonadaceae bacterium]